MIPLRRVTFLILLEGSCACKAEKRRITYSCHQISGTIYRELVSVSMAHWLKQYQSFSSDISRFTKRSKWFYEICENNRSLHFR